MANKSQRYHWAQQLKRAMRPEEEEKMLASCVYYYACVYYKTNEKKELKAKRYKPWSVRQLERRIPAGNVSWQSVRSGRRCVAACIRPVRHVTSRQTVICMCYWDIAKRV